MLHRGRYYFPFELPADMLCSEPREGDIVPDLPIPLEDLSTGWKQAGAVGQEVYGGAIAYILTTYMYHRFEEVPVIIYSNYPIYQAEYRKTDRHSGYAVLRLSGTADYSCRVRLLAEGQRLPVVTLMDEDNQVDGPLVPSEQDDTYQEYRVSGNMRIRVEWTKHR